ncbi:methyltransferase domain-containing protein [Microbacterium sp.]|uniref:methyltransferase domain-containing protein n=1 Tax=Microbacterium sp. TaxID=51671 RepID=UPI002811BB29|nr:methyltransferase domain-containing protein [Microbacterium sp.]
MPDLSVRASAARELMDDPAADLRMLQRTYQRFALVNAVVSRWRTLYRREIRPRAQRRPVRILDIGAGGGDISRALSARLRRDGIPGEVTAVDLDARAIAWARAQDAGSGVRYRCAPAGELADEGERFDVVLSNHVLHHLAPEELSGVLADSRRLVAPGGVVCHHDIARSRTAYVLFAVATAPLAPTLFAGSFIRTDGLISIRRSYTPDELAAVVPEGWRVRTGIPARLELRWEEADAGP